MKLIMAKIGARPKGRLIEQHDVVFAVVNSLSDIVPIVDETWSEVKGKWHVDAWREVHRVGDYKIEILPQQTPHIMPESEPKLFFINLGGYLPNQFEEFHYKTLVVAETVSKATAQVRKSDFYRNYTFDNANPTLSGVATSHVDDKMALDIDDIHCVSALLPKNFRIAITALTESEKLTIAEDFLHIGYLPLKALKKGIEA